MGEGTAGGSASGDHNDGDHNDDAAGAADDRGEPSRQARKQQAAEARKQARLQDEKRKQAEKLEKKLLKERRRLRRRARLRRGLRLATGWGVAAIVVAGVGYYAYTRYGNSSGAGGPDDTRTITNGAVPPITAKPTTPVAQAAGPPSDPFAGTPAATWADGAAGIIVPAAKPVGRYSASQVKDAYQTTKKLLVAAALTPQTLDGGAPTAFTNLLTRSERTQFVGGLNKIGTDKQGVAVSTRAYLISFAPGTTKFIGSVIKVHGTMTARLGKDSGGHAVLDVDVNYRVAYAVEPPKAPADWMRIVAQFNGPVHFGDWTDSETPFEPWWDVGLGVAGGRCGSKDGFVHPDFPSGPADTTPVHGKAINPYSLGDNGPAGCGATTGT